MSRLVPGSGTKAVLSGCVPSPKSTSSATSDAGSKAPQQIALEGQVGDVSLRASGTVENVLDLAGLGLALEAHAPRLPLPDD